MADEYVDLVVRVPVEVVRRVQAQRTAYTADKYRADAERDVKGGFFFDALHAFGVVAALEFDLPAERVPVTPETPWGTVIGNLNGERTFLAHNPKHPSGIQFASCTSGGGITVSYYTDDWYEVRRP
jgi:hypothetical protein